MTALLTRETGPARVLPRFDCVHDLVAAQAARTPEAEALAFEGESLTYGELWPRVTQLAAFLRQRGVSPRSHVGVLLERSLDLPIALLGVLQTGATYVPLDPIYSAERLNYMVEDARLHLLITQSSLEAKVGGGPAPLVLLDRHRAHVASAWAAEPEVRPTPEDTAYVIYTSGSTGKPKGVEVLHRGLTNFLHSMASEPGCGPDDRLLALTTVCFDIAALELFLPLTTGACVELVSAETARDGLELRRALDTRRATIVQATPVTFKMLLAAGWEGSLSLKVLCGGDALDPTTAAALIARSQEVWNLYGPTETTVWSTACQLRAGEQITLGRPIANTRLHVLDPHRRPVPVGAEGELYIGGDGLARGYWRRPELTDERFVVNPFGPGRLYRTGDLCRPLPNGSWECLGRIDHQVKVQGYRIELGEVEAVLQHQPSVRHAVVVARELGGEQQLAAYVAGEGLDLVALRAALVAQLPDYMVPSVITPLIEMPLTPNGKVDRHALPAPDAPVPVVTHGSVPPCTPKRR